MRGGGGGSPRCEDLSYFFFVSRSRTAVWLLFNGLLDLLFCLFYVIREFDRFLHRVSAKRRNVKVIMMKTCFCPPSIPEAAIFNVNNTCGNA